jgi:hypothetical protein
MAQFSNRLCNPTPFPVKIKWHRGIRISIPPFQHVELTPDQTEDFRGNTPGWEAIQNEMQPLGIFLFNPNEDYNVQALRAIKSCLKAKSERVNEAFARQRDRRVAMGIDASDTVIKESLIQMGIDRIEKEIEILKSHVVPELEKALANTSDDTGFGSYDPERTLFVTDPIKEFPSKELLNIYLGLPENSEIKKKHLAFTTQLNKQEKVDGPRSENQ